MQRRTWILIPIAAFVVCGLVLLIRAQTSNPNVLLITINGTRLDRLGCYGAPATVTPTLDELAAGGVVFERAYAAAPIALPSHASLLTGIYPPEHTVRDNTGATLNEKIPTLAELVQQRGRQTAAFVATSVLSSETGLNQGFQTYEAPPAKLENLPNACATSCIRRTGDEVVEAALEWLKVHEQPFFCWVNLCDPELDSVVDRESSDARPRSRAYDDQLAVTDQQVRRLVKFLDERGLHRDTLVIVAGAHGTALGDHGEPSHGYLLYNSTIQVPLIVSQPGRIVAGHRVAEPVSLTDLFPSVLEWLKLPSPAQIRGTSIVSAFRGEPVGPRLIYAETEAGHQRHGWAPLYSVITGNRKYIWSRTPELYDLQHDAGEEHDLAESNVPQAQEMDAILAGMSREMVPYWSAMAGLRGIDRAVMQSLGDSDSHAQKVRSLDLHHLPDVREMMPTANRLEEACARFRAGDYASAVEILEQLINEAPDLTAAQSLLEVCRRMQEETRSQAVDADAE